MEGEKFDPTQLTVSGRREKSPEEIRRYNEKIDAELDFEIEDLEKEVEKLKSGPPSEELAEKQKELERLKRRGALIAHGGTRFEQRTRWGKWERKYTNPEKTKWEDSPNTGFMEDDYGAWAGDKLSFGVGEWGINKLLVFRIRQNVQNRGGYPYTLLIDPGEAVWRRAGNNGAAIIQKIMEDEELYGRLMERIEELPIPGGDVAKLFRERFALVDLTVEGKPDKKFADLFKQADQGQDVVVVGKDFMAEKPDPKEIAAKLASIPEELRKHVNFIFGGGRAHARACDFKIVWDPRK